MKKNRKALNGHALSWSFISLLLLLIHLEQTNFYGNIYRLQQATVNMQNALYAACSNTTPPWLLEVFALRQKVIFMLFLMITSAYCFVHSVNYFTDECVSRSMQLSSTASFMSCNGMCYLWLHCH